MTANRSVAIRTSALGCASVIALLALSACEQPSAPAPLPPPPPEQDEMRAPDPGPPPETDDLPSDMDDEGPKPPDADDSGPTMEEQAPPEEYEPERPRGPIAMAPIPNPPDRDEYGRRWRRGRAPRPVEAPKPPEIADAAEPPVEAAPLPPGTMAPIPNPPERARAPRAPRGDSGLMGAPPPVRVAPRRPVRAPAVTAPPPIAAGPVARAPIAPATPTARPAPAAPRAPASTAAPATTPAPSASASGSTGAASTAVADAAGPTSASRPQTLDQAAETLRGRVESEARLETPATWTAGQTAEVRLRFPEGFAQEVANATAGAAGPGASTELSATLAGDGYRIEPAGPQSISADGAANGIVWRVTPSRADPGPLRATVEASAPVAGGRRVLPLGEVGDRPTSGGFSLSPTLGWILALLAAAALVFWIATRRPGGNGDSAEDRRRRRRRAEQNAMAGTQPFDFRPDSDSAEARAARVDQLRAEEDRRRAEAEAAARGDDRPGS